MQGIGEWSKRRGLLLISDEVYRESYFGERPPPSAAEYAEQFVVLSGVSKMAAMTGWRLGWAYGPEEIVRRVTVAHQYTSSCASWLSQKAALKIFTAEGREQVAEIRRRLRANWLWCCDFIATHLRRECVIPEGAFYVLLAIGETGLDSYSCALELLKDGVATIPGVAFGSEGEGFLRLSFASEPRQLELGFQRLGHGLERLRKSFQRGTQDMVKNSEIRG